MVNLCYGCTKCANSESCTLWGVRHLSTSIILHPTTSTHVYGTTPWEQSLTEEGQTVLELDT